jgi:hypothetical protein
MSVANIEPMTTGTTLAEKDSQNGPFHAGKNKDPQSRRQRANPLFGCFEFIRVLRPSRWKLRRNRRHRRNRVFAVQLQRAARNGLPGSLVLGYRAIHQSLMESAIVAFPKS